MAGPPFSDKWNLKYPAKRLARAMRPGGTERGQKDVSVLSLLFADTVFFTDDREGQNYMLLAIACTRARICCPAGHAVTFIADVESVPTTSSSAWLSMLSTGAARLFRGLLRSTAFKPESCDAGVERRSGLVLLAALGVIIVTCSLQHSLPASWPFNRKIPSSSETYTPRNVAAIIEDRPLASLAPLLLHFSSVLGPAWPIVLFASEDVHPDSVPFLRAVEEGRNSVRRLPPDVHFANHQAVSEFLTLPWFWEQLAPAGHVLLFQADSILCANSDARVEDFLGYDFVGAPMDVPANPSVGYGAGYNGGLSLRNRSMMLDIVNSFNWKGEKAQGKITQEPCLKFED
ncbi:MAG: hypothetical protein M1818_004633 [Claussenomyces sp. TS43310]|nr:MAG: hypothetical protein M1818_004633 [Claussenomyces sp. TS43310]